RILRRVNKWQRDHPTRIAEWRGDPNATSFPPTICDISYKLAAKLGVHLGNSGGQPGAQRAVQSVIQRVINAIAQEQAGTTSAGDALDQDASNALAAGEQGQTREILRTLKSQHTRAMVLSH